jgi:hypothetical protein
MHRGTISKNTWTKKLTEMAVASEEPVGEVDIT